jgi:hypothetical protein
MQPNASGITPGLPGHITDISRMKLSLWRLCTEFSEAFSTIQIKSGDIFVLFVDHYFLLFMHGYISVSSQISILFYFRSAAYGIPDRIYHVQDQVHYIYTSRIPVSGSRSLPVNWIMKKSVSALVGFSVSPPSRYLRVLWGRFFTSVLASVIFSNLLPGLSQMRKYFSNP